MKKIDIIAFIFACFFASSSVLAQAPAQIYFEGVCGPHKEMTEQLKKEYKEEPTAIGLTKAGKVFELYSSSETNAWTGLITATNGMSCMFVTGNDLEIIKKQLKKKGPKI